MPYVQSTPTPSASQMPGPLLSPRGAAPTGMYKVQCALCLCVHLLPCARSFSAASQGAVIGGVAERLSSLLFRRGSLEERREIDSRALVCAERDWVGLKDCSTAGGRVEACQLLACVSRLESRDSKDGWLEQGTEAYEAKYMQMVHGKTRRKREVLRLSRPCESFGRAFVAACLWTWLGRLDQQPGDSRLVPVRRSITPC